MIRIHCKDISMKGNTPFLSHARKLIAEGVDPDTRVEFYDDNYDPRVIIHNVGEAAQLTVNNDTKFIRLPEYSKL